ncbi:DUF1214 domain-containing protein [Oerskovia sp. M15]
MFYTATVITPAMCMRLTGVGSQYLISNVDTSGAPSTGPRSTGAAAQDIPAARFWSFTLYDNQTRSMLQTPQLYPRAAARSTPRPPQRPKRTAPRSSTSPTQPADVGRGNWVQTDPERGWFVVLRLYSPLQPFFDKSWRAGEVELVT